ncbi:STAS domain-containing protein [Fibrobacterota bacterium]
MEFNMRQVKRFTVIDLPDIVNFEANLSLKEKLEEICKQKERNVAVDLTNVSFIGSLGVGLLAFAKKMTEDSKGNFCLIGPNRTITRIINRTGLKGIFTVYRDESQIPD